VAKICKRGYSPPKVRQGLVNRLIALYKKDHPEEFQTVTNATPKGYSPPKVNRDNVTTQLLILFDTKDNFFYIVSCAGVVKLVDARDSKSRGASTPCRFDSDLRHQFLLVHKEVGKNEEIPSSSGY
jgi:hypothetical protein